MLQPWPIMLGDTLAQSYFLKVHSIRQRNACILRSCLPAWMKLSYEPPLSACILDDSPACPAIAILKTVASRIIFLIHLISLLWMERKTFDATRLSDAK